MGVLEALRVYPWQSHPVGNRPQASCTPPRTKELAFNYLSECYNLDFDL